MLQELQWKHNALVVELDQTRAQLEAARVAQAEAEALAASAPLVPPIAYDDRQLSSGSSRSGSGSGSSLRSTAAPAAPLTVGGAVAAGAAAAAAAVEIPGLRRDKEALEAELVELKLQVGGAVAEADHDRLCRLISYLSFWRWHLKQIPFPHTVADAGPDGGH